MRFFSWPRIALRLCLVLSGCLLASSVTAQSPVTAENSWLQWRGPHRSGHLANPVTWPATLSNDNVEELWRIEMGPSYSGPIVTADRVYVTETVDKTYEAVRALDRASGQEVWKVQWEGSLSVPFFAKANGDWIRSTPTLDNGRLYVAGMRDVLVCLDAETGNEIWRLDFVAETGSELPNFGFVCSPLVHNGFVYVQAGGGFAKVDAGTGELAWIVLKDGGGMMGSAFSSPVLATLHDQPQFLVQTRTELCGVDPENGAVLWKHEIPAFRGMNILTPTVVGNRIFTSSYGGKSFLFEVTHADGQWNLEEVWTNRKEGYMSSPVVIDDHVYLHLRNQRFTCLDLASGDDAWTTETFGKYWSLVANGSRILALDETGDLYLIEASPDEFRLVGSAKVADEEAWAHVAVAGDEIFVRQLNAIVAYRWKP